MTEKRISKDWLLPTPLGLGLAALGRPGYINLGHREDLEGEYSVEAMQAHAHEVLDAAWAGGIRYFDAARSYGRAEAFLGTWLRRRGFEPAAVTVGSKWGYTYTADWNVSLEAGQPHEVKEHSLPVLKRQIDESRKQLGAYLKLYQIHSATLESGVMENRAVLAGLAGLRNSGLAIGFSVSGPRQAETIWRGIEIEFDGAPLFASVQATWNLLERSATDALRAAHDAGLVVLNKEALANGRLTERNQAPAFAEKIARLRVQAESLGTTVDAVALAACLAQPFIDVVLSGAAQVGHLGTNLAAVDVPWDNALEAAFAGFADPADEYWRTRSGLAWN